MKNTEEILTGYPAASRDALIPILQEIQLHQEYLSEESVVKVGRHLRIPASKIYGVATFYNQFRFKPKGKFHIEVCRGTACHVLGSLTVLEHLEKKLRIKLGSTTNDGLFSLEAVACIGACGLAPVLCINGKFYAGVTAKSIDEIIDNLKENTQYEKSEANPAEPGL
jgi:NADH-quinone oxidoreductase E subunit